MIEDKKTVRDYYKEHFSELSYSKKFHFATRMKNWFKTDEYNEFLATNEPDHNLLSILQNNNYSGVVFYEARKPFFEKYNGLYGLEATLFRVFHLLHEYSVDLREDFLSLYGGKEKLYALCDELRADDDAFFTLTTFLVNVIALTEELFPRNIDIYAEMLEKALSSTQDVMKVYLYTHIMLCESCFYHKNIDKHLDLYRQALENCDKIISDSFDEISFDMKFEFLVCARMINYNPAVKEQIRDEAAKNKDGYIRDPRKIARLNSVDGAEHRNVLYIMSGLDTL